MFFKKPGFVVQALVESLKNYPTKWKENQYRLFLGQHQDTALISIWLGGYRPQSLKLERPYEVKFDAISQQVLYRAIEAWQQCPFVEGEFLKVLKAAETYEA